MYNTNIPANQELPSTGRLIKSTILAIIAAGVLLVTIVMPAEYGVDPTGVGELVGLKKMGEIKVSLAEEAAADSAEGIEAASQPTAPVEAEANISVPVLVTEPVQPSLQLMNHEMKVTLAPNESAEIKVDMAKGSKVQYTWWTDGGRANFDVHGDSKLLKINYHNYSKGSEQKSEGALEAAFDGSHGWFWRNRTSETLNITLQTEGEYTNIIRLK